LNEKLSNTGGNNTNITVVLLGRFPLARDLRQLNICSQEQKSLFFFIILSLLTFLVAIALEPLELIVQYRMLYKLLNIMDNTAHPLYDSLIKTKLFQLEGFVSTTEVKTIVLVISAH